MAKDGDCGQAYSRGGHIGAEVVRDTGAHSSEEPVLR
jgi:hypothetical protein